LIKISVIIPVYNAEKYIERCIESVLEQNIKEIEIICVDDGSTDSSLSILKDYEQKYSNIYVLSQKNSYAGVARNFGLTVAKGEYVHFLDSDDYLAPDAYEKPYALAKKLNLDYVKARSIGFDAQTGNRKIYHYYDLTGFDTEIFGDIVSMQTHAYELLDTSCTPWAGIVKRDFIMDRNIRFNDLKCVNDRSFYADIIVHTNRIAFCDSYITYHQTNRSDSLVGIRSENFSCHLDSYQIIEKNTADVPADIRGKLLGGELKDITVWYDKLTDEQKKENQDLIKDFFYDFKWREIDLVYAIAPWMQSIYDLLNKTYSDIFDYQLNGINQLLDFIDKADSFVIYGAGQVSHRLLRFLSGDGARLKKCRGIAVSGMEGNPSEIMGIPIYEKSECFPAKTDAVIIATFENVHMEILRMLVNEGVCNVKAIMNGLGESLNVTC